jgi:hypothetical protein
MMAIGSRLCLLVAGVTLVAGSAFAQAPNPETTPGDAKPTAPARRGSQISDAPLRLDERVNPAVSMACAVHWLDRAWGKPKADD